MFGKLYTKLFKRIETKNKNSEIIKEFSLLTKRYLPSTLQNKFEYVKFNHKEITANYSYDLLKKSLKHAKKSVYLNNYMNGNSDNLLEIYKELTEKIDGMSETDVDFFNLKSIVRILVRERTADTEQKQKDYQRSVEKSKKEIKEIKREMNIYKKISFILYLTRSIGNKYDISIDNLQTFTLLSIGTMNKYQYVNLTNSLNCYIQSLQKLLNKYE